MIEMKGYVLIVEKRRRDARRREGGMPVDEKEGCP
jgi:hypothetical protein